MALNLTSKTLNPFTRPILWKVVEVGQVDKRVAKDLECVLCAVLRTPAFGQLIQSLSFRNYGIKNDRDYDNEKFSEIDQLTGAMEQLSTLNLSSDIDTRSLVEEWDTWGQLALLLLRLPNLQSVKIHFEQRITF